MFLVSALIFMAVQGGAEGRCLILAVVVATLSTVGFHQALGIEPAQPFILIVDTALLVVIGHVAMTSRAHWPIWFCGLHAITVATGFARFAFPAQLPTIYTNFAGFWAFPALSAAVVGVLLDRRAPLLNFSSP